MRAATSAELRAWDDLVLANPDGGHILQTRAWGEFKRQHGWRPHYMVHAATGGSLAVLFLGRAVPGLGELWYAPKGPGLTEPSALGEIFGDRTAFPGVFGIKVEPEIHAGVGAEGLVAAGFVKAPRDVQISRATIILDLRPSEEALLASFKSKCRYNIRLASRKGVAVRSLPVDDRTVEVMYRLMVATQNRARFTLRRRQYFEDYWRLQHASGQGSFFFALHGDEVLAGVFVTTLGNKAWYKDGGSVKRHSELMAPHLLQWEVIRRLRSQGIESYDLVAVPRPEELAPDHPLYGLHRFKSGFSEKVTEFVGAWDLPLDRRRYALWTRFGERAAHHWALRVHQDLFY